MQNLVGKTVLVTGGSRGIGAGICRLLARRGAGIAIHFNEGRQEAESVLASLPGPAHATVQADLADLKQAQALPDQVVEILGRLDAVVNNAGIYELHDITSVDPGHWQKAWQRTISTNLLGPAQVCHGAVPHLRAAGGGHIVNISSRGAFRGEPDAPAYGAAKAGLNSLSQSLAIRLAPEGIIVTAVAPGWVRTDMTEGYLDGPQGQAIRQQSPLGRTATVEEVAEVVALILSGRADALAGAVIDVNCASYLR